MLHVNYCTVPILVRTVRVYAYDRTFRTYVQAKRGHQSHLAFALGGDSAETPKQSRDSKPYPY
jgi:hypothetical protein